MRLPNSEEWKQMMNAFNQNWNFQNSFGAMDGKHIRIQAPRNSGSNYFNYKQYFSFILLAACDANYRFTLVDIGSFGSLSDGSVFKDSKFGQAFENNEIPIPKPQFLAGQAEKAPKALS